MEKSIYKLTRAELSENDSRIVNHDALDEDDTDILLILPSSAAILDRSKKTADPIERAIRSLGIDPEIADLETDAAVKQITPSAQPAPKGNGRKLPFNLEESIFGKKK